MDSSISHSNSTRVPWTALGLLATAFAAWLAGALYMLKINPEIAFLKQAHQLKMEWASKLPAGPRTLVYGGSSGHTSINPQRMLASNNLHVVNLALGAGMGARMLSNYALDHAAPGDSIVIALEPWLLMDNADIEPLASNFSFAVGQLRWLARDGHLNRISALLDLRPGGYHAVTLAWKLLLRQPLYRYQQSELQTGGWHRVPHHREISIPTPGPLRLSIAGESLLREVRARAAAKSVRVAYSLPWMCAEPAQADAQKKFNAAFLLQISQIIPVLKDPRLGVFADPTHYTDTCWHPDEATANLHSDELAPVFKSWSLWTSADLKSLSK